MPTFQIYKSSAGSGKTTVLIQSFLKLSLGSPSPFYFKKILAVTFTNKAATEMKERLIAELDKIGQLPDNYSGTDFMVNSLIDSLNVDLSELRKRARAMFDEVLQSYDELGISTIDQFNHRLIRSFSRELAISSDFEVETDEKPLFAEAIDRLMDKVGVNSHITGHLISYIELQLEEEKGVSIKRDLEKLFGMVLNESSYDAMNYIAVCPPEKFESVRSDFSKQVKQIEEKIRGKGKEALDKIHDAGLTEDDLFQKKSGVFGFFKKLQNFDVDGTLVNSYVQKTLDGKWLKSKPSVDIEGRLASIQHEMDDLLSTCVLLVETELPKYFFLKNIFTSIDLIAILDELSASFEAVCEERNVLPISRFNRLISDALRKEPAAYIYENYGARYSHILIDEFQDTSEMQWFNLLPLLEESISQGHLNLVVGDAKQSIYRWRGSKAEQLIELPGLLDLPPDFPAGIRDVFAQSSHIESLQINYRSRDKIVLFNNFFIGEMGKRSLSDKSIYRKEYTVDNVKQKLQSKEGGYVEVRKLNKDDTQENKWEALVGQIQDCCNAGYSYSDMAILVRSTNKEGREIVDQLRENGIAVDTAQSFELDKNQQVALILSLIRLASDNSNNAAKVRAMRCLSEIHGFKFDPTPYTAGKGRNNQIVFDAFLKDNALPGLPKFWSELGVFDLTESIVSTYSTEPADPFVTAFANLVYNKFGLGGTPSAFIDWWDDLSEKPSAGIPNSGNAVQIMTIHKAKGLQFKVVFIPDFNWALRTNSNNLQWFNLEKIPESPLLYAPLPLNSKLERMGLAEEWQAEEEANNFDNLNLAYVAVTRAEEALFLNYKSGKSNEINRFLDEIVDELEAEDSLEPVKNGDENSFTLKIGALQQKAVDKKTDSIPKITETHHNTSWSSNIKFAFQPDSQDRDVGNHFHRIMSQSSTYVDAEKKLKVLFDRAHVNSRDFSELSKMLKDIYSDPWFLSLMDGAEVFQEREFLWNGTVFRPDLVLVKNEKVTVVDWKTGGEKPEHQNQITQYASAIGQIENRPCEAYLVYFSPFQKRKVEIPVQKSLFD